MKALLISTYELGHQPFGLASPAAWLRQAGAEVACLDMAVQQLAPELVAGAGLVAIYLPMHTATRLATTLIPQLRQTNPHAHLCCFGLYAPVNEPLLRRLGVQTILGGEFESGLTALYRRLSEKTNQEPRTKNHQTTESLDNLHFAIQNLQSSQPEPRISLAKQSFILPDRSGLPGLSSYAYLELGDGAARTVGYTEASRGCKHLCRHCPIVPVYGGHFRVIQRAVVLEDVRQQVAAGAQHISFGDPDFFNGPGHAIPLVQALHDEFPTLSYDVTIKIEHLLKHADLLPILRETGCLFITSAVEAVDDAILERFDKRHTRADFVRAAGLLRELELTLNPTFVSFTPWTTRQGYVDFLQLIADLDLIEHVAPIQYAIRLLIPAGSRLLELDDVRQLVGPYAETALAHPWAHPDPQMDRLYQQVMRAVRVDRPRQEAFELVWQLAQAALDSQELAAPASSPSCCSGARRAIPHLSEPWYCCAEPDEEQLALEFV